MLQLIRDRAQGIIVWVIVGLIIVTFALFGLGSYMSGASQSVVATVNGVEITQNQFLRAYQNYQDNLQRMLGERYNPDMFPEKQMKQTVIDGLVTQALLEQLLNDDGFAASPAQITASITALGAFQDENGKFSRERYDELLRQQGMSSEMLEADIAKDLMTQQFNDGISATAFATPAEVLQILRLQNQQRDIGYLMFAAQPFQEGIDVTDAEIEEDYKSNSARYMEPEQVKLAYLVLDIGDLAKHFSVSDEEVLAAYQQSLQSYTVGTEERRARHILIKVDEETKDDAAKKQAEDLRARISSGESFEKLAGEFSADPGSASQGGDLGFFGRGVMDEAFEDAAFGLKPGELSEPVRSRFGYHLILLEEIKAPKITPFEQVRDKLRKELQIQQAEQRFYEDSEKFYNLVYENPDSLEPAAAELGLDIQHSDWLTRSGGKGLFSARELIDAGFSPEVLKEGRNSDLIQLGDTKLVALRLNDHQEAIQKPLEEVKDSIREQIRVRKAAEAAFAAAEEARKRMQDGEDPQSIARDMAQASWTRIGLTGRTDSGATVPADIRQQAFAMPRSSDSEPVFETVRLVQGDVAVVGVFAVSNKTEPTEDQIKQEQQRLATSIGQAEYSRVLQQLREQAKVTINLPEDETF